MDSVFIFFMTGLTGFIGLFYLHHFPEESDETQSASRN
jgi:thioester reductase-like protein